MRSASKHLKTVIVYQTVWSKQFMVNQSWFWISKDLFYVTICKVPSWLQFQVWLLVITRLSVIDQKITLCTTFLISWFISTGRSMFCSVWWSNNLIRNHASRLPEKAWLLRRNKFLFSKIHRPLGNRECHVPNFTEKLKQRRANFVKLRRGADWLIKPFKGNFVVEFVTVTDVGQ